MSICTIPFGCFITKAFVISYLGFVLEDSCLDDCSRKVASKWSERKRSVNVLNVLEDWIMINGKHDRVTDDNGKQFTSNIFRRFLVSLQSLQG